MPEGPQAALRDGGLRLHLRHGPIDLLIGAEGPGSARETAFAAAARRFDGLLEGLVAELALLRAPLAPGLPPPAGAVARRMHGAALAHAGDRFLTPMIAVAGAVADEILAAMTASAALERAYVNNGGDIAFHLAPGARFTAMIAGLQGQDHGRVSLGHGDGAGGLATSGRGGRSFSFGIAEAVTVVARTGAGADAAATLVCNASDLPDHPGIARRPAAELQPDSDLGDRLVVTGASGLTHADIARALDGAEAEARRMLDRGLILGAAMVLGGEMRIAGAGFTGPRR
ncbi:UPF0280 family protein [Albidovulum sp.]|uniref:UPF0280 family protein n=1 Tax=Albidovulum sp. TaxID=1872424 RepID=UPI001DA725AE|nr:UPF0280 family protein [Paracoccaceae bacterium]